MTLHVNMDNVIEPEPTLWGGDLICKYLHWNSKRANPNCLILNDWAAQDGTIVLGP
jgi:hypothetical protein